MDSIFHFMQAAITLGRTNPKYPFGSVIVARSESRIVAEGVNRVQENPLWHAEILAIHHFAEAQHSISWPDLDLYTTAEPCPMCQSAILWAGIGRVFFGVSISRLTELGWRQIAIPAKTIVQKMPGASCEIMGGVLEEDCEDLFRSARRLQANRDS